MEAVHMQESNSSNNDDNIVIQKNTKKIVCWLGIAWTDLPRRLYVQWGRYSSDGRVLGSQSCLMQRRGFDPTLRRIFPVEGIFPLGLTWVLTPFPQNSFGWEYKPRSSLCTHAVHLADSKDIDNHVLGGGMPATKLGPTGAGFQVTPAINLIRYLSLNCSLDTEVGTKLLGQVAELQRTADFLAATGLRI